MEKKIKGSVLTDIGVCREYNDDAVCAVPKANFYAVADGIGQIAFGGMTAEMTCRHMAVQAEKIYQDYQIHGDEERTSKELKDALTEISNQIFRSGNTPEVYRYGCTFCGIMILGEHLAVVNIGDSRAYAKYRDPAGFVQITEDHNLAAVAVKEGYMTYEEAVKNRLTSRLLNFVGISDTTEADLFLVDYRNIETILLCSDGLSSMVTDKDMENGISAHKNPEEICSNLIDMANQNGGKDNVSVAVIKLD